MEARFIVRQGDILLVRVKQLPQDAQPVQHGKDGIILALGEVTGHRHRIDSDPAAPVAQEYRAKKPVPVFDAVAERFIQVLEKAELRHEEHATIHLPAGNYAVIQQREYFPEEIRNVTD